jgi:hypothetical protein
MTPRRWPTTNARTRPKKAQLDDFVGGKVRDYALLVTLSTGVPVAVPPLDRDVLRPLMTGQGPGAFPRAGR